MKEVLIVDGYNVIGAWGELREMARQDKLEDARDRLIEILIEYQAAANREVYVVFDAYQVPGSRREYKSKGVHVLFTKKEETADELIEKMVRWSEKYTSQIYVATSDYQEQQITFGDGALRISARELKKEVTQAKQKVRERLERLDMLNKNTLGDSLNQEVAKIFEKWRRK